MSKKDQRSVEELIEAWVTLSPTTRREIIRGIREHTQCDGDWHGREDLAEAGKLTVKMLRALGPL